MIDNSPLQKRIMNKVYQSKLSTKNTPYIHAMHKVFHQRFYKQYDNKYQEIALSEFLKNTSHNHNGSLNVSSIKQKDNASENSFSLNILNQLKQQIVEPEVVSNNVNKSQISKKSSEKLEEENKKIEMKKKNVPFQGNVAQSQIKKVNKPEQIEIKQEKKKVQESNQILKNLNEEQNLKSDKKSMKKQEQKKEDSDEEEEVEVIDQPTFYSIKQKMSQIPQVSKLVTKSNIQNMKKIQISVQDFKKYSSQIKQIQNQQINIIHKKSQNILPQEVINNQLFNKNKGPQIMKKDAQNIVKDIIIEKESKIDIKENVVSNIDKIKLVPKFDSSIKFYSSLSQQIEIKPEIIPLPHQNDKKQSSKSQSSQNVKNKAFIQPDSSSSNNEAKKDSIDHNKILQQKQQRSLIKLELNQLNKQNESMYMDSPKTQALQYANEHSRQMSDLDVIDNSQQNIALDHSNQHHEMKDSLELYQPMIEKYHEQKKNKSHENEPILKQIAQIQKAEDVKEQEIKDNHFQKQQVIIITESIIQQRQQSVESNFNMIVQSQYEPIIQIIHPLQHEQNYPYQVSQPQVQNQSQKEAPIIEMFENVQNQNGSKKDQQLSTQIYVQIQSINNRENESDSFQTKIKNLINSYKASLNQISKQQMSRHISKQQQIKLLRQENYALKNKGQALQKQKFILNQQNQRLRFQSKLKTGQYEMKITVLNSYITQLKQKLESQQFYMISHPNKALHRRKKSQNLITNHLSQHEQSQLKEESKSHVFASAIGTKRNNEKRSDGQQERKEDQSEDDNIQKSSRKNSSQLQSNNEEKSSMKNSSELEDKEKKSSVKNSSQQNKAFQEQSEEE